MKITPSASLKGPPAAPYFARKLSQTFKSEGFFLFFLDEKYFDNSLVILAVRSPTQLPEAIQSNFATL